VRVWVWKKALIINVHLSQYCFQWLIDTYRLCSGCRSNFFQQIYCRFKYFQRVRYASDQLWFNKQHSGQEKALQVNQGFSTAVYFCPNEVY